MTQDPESTRLREFFRAMAHRSFSELGLCNDAVVGYVAAVLTEFARADRLYALRTETGGAIDSIVRALLESTSTASGKHGLFRARAVRKYVGDYALFMSGLFRAYVERKGALDYYLAEGQRSYWAVSEFDLSLYRGGFLFFQELSKNFEYYSGALDYMRKAYFTPDPGRSPFEAFLRQVEGWITSGLSDN